MITIIESAAQNISAVVAAGIIGLFVGLTAGLPVGAWLASRKRTQQQQKLTPRDLARY